MGDYVDELVRCFVLKDDGRPKYLFSLYSFDNVNIVVREPSPQQGMVENVFKQVSVEAVRDRILSGVQIEGVRRLLNDDVSFFITLSRKRMDILTKDEYHMYDLVTYENVDQDVVDLFQGFYIPSFKNLTPSLFQSIVEKNSNVRVNMMSEYIKSAVKIYDLLSDSSLKLYYLLNFLSNKTSELNDKMNVPGEDLELHEEYVGMLTLLEYLYDNGDVTIKYNALLTDLIRRSNLENDFNVSNYF